jgi:tRNA pseudouridine55 synthase
MARIDLSPILATRFLQGQRLSMGREGIVLPDAVREARIYHEDRLLGVADITPEGLLAPRRLVQLSS